jgi:hypothetical protein
MKAIETIYGVCQICMKEEDIEEMEMVRAHDSMLGSLPICTECDKKLNPEDYNE